MDLNFFKKNRILDGGMGQELLARGMKPEGTLWSASALLNKDYHKLLEPFKLGVADVVYGSRFIGSDKKRVLYFFESADVSGLKIQLKVVGGPWTAAPSGAQDRSRRRAASPFWALLPSPMTRAL